MGSLVHAGSASLLLSSPLALDRYRWWAGLPPWWIFRWYDPGVFVQGINDGHGCVLAQQGGEFHRRVNGGNRDGVLGLRYGYGCKVARLCRR